MKKIFSLFLAICLIILQTGFIYDNYVSAENVQLRNEPDHKEPKKEIGLQKLFSNNTDSSLTLWYTQPARQWMLQALPIGNGNVGAMVFGTVKKEHLQFNEKSLWSGRPQAVTNPLYQPRMDKVKKLLASGSIPEADSLLKEAGGFPREHFGAFQPFGDLYMEFDHGDEATDYRRDLNLSKALASVNYRINGVSYRREYFASFPDQVVVMRITADQPGKINMHVTMTTRQAQGKLIVSNGLKLIVKGTMTENKLQYSSHVKINPDGGTTSTTATGIEIKKANSVVLLLTAKTNYAMNWPGCLGDFDPDQVASNYIEKASKKTYEQLLNAHLKDYDNLFNRVQLKLDRHDDRRSLPTDQALIAYTKSNEQKMQDGGDPTLEALLFNYGRYLMIASSRKGSLPANLQGIWNNSKTPAWDSDYHTDINLEMNYWINGPTNLPECFSPFTDYVDFLRGPGRKTAKDYFNANGFFVNIYTNPWGYAEPRWSWTGASGWLCQNLYDHFLFSGDQDYLRNKAYPIMKEACSLYLDLLVPYKDKSLVIAPSVSPEINFRFSDNKTYRTSAGAAIDQQIVYDLFVNTIEAARILKTDPSLINTLTDRLKRLSAPVKIGNNGMLQEWVEDWQAEDLQHRHISHLYALYPGRMIDPIKTPEWTKAAMNSLTLRGDNQTGWGTTWRIACYARLGEAEKAHTFFKSIIRHCIDTSIVYRNGGGAYDNLLTCHSPFQIDGNFGYSAAVAEMLLQSHVGNWQQGYEIHLLPALPKAWPNGMVKGLMARGGLTVDVEWKAGKLVKAMISSELEKTTKVTYKGKTIEIKISKGKPLSLDAELKKLNS
ncbi:glycoside hydrolase family 95 protein [Flavitalea sp.]|nr:glycoside hydrolase family 95 protein [Flavitalea sp.]